MDFKHSRCLRRSPQIGLANEHLTLQGIQLSPNNLASQPVAGTEECEKLLPDRENVANGQNKNDDITSMETHIESSPEHQEKDHHEISEFPVNSSVSMPATQECGLLGLPNEILHHICFKVAQNSVVDLQVMKRVCTRLREIAEFVQDRKPSEIHISRHLHHQLGLDIVYMNGIEIKISVMKLIRTAGRRSGLAIELKRLLGNT